MTLVGIMWSDSPTTLNRLADLKNINLEMNTIEPIRPIMMIDGNHRTHGLQKAHRDYPKKPLYRILKLILLILPRNRVNIQMCLFIGNSRNYVAQVYVKPTQWAAVCQYRRQFEELEADQSLSPAERVKEFAAYKIRTQPQIHFEQNTTHTFSALCQVPDSVWQLMVQIFSGQFKLNQQLKGQTTPTAMTHFTSMANIPPVRLCEWLQRVIDGQWVTNMFLKRCKLYTKQIRVAGQVLEHIQYMRQTKKFETLEDVAKCYPDVLDDDWMNTVINSCEDGQKQKLSPHAISLIVDMMERQEKLDKEPKVFYVVVVYFFHQSFFFQ